MRTLNKFIACEPTEKVSMDIKTTRGFSMPQDRESFLSTVVLFPHRSSILEPGVTWASGTKVHLRGEMYRHEWNRKVFTHKIGDTEVRFILVPEDQVVAVEDGSPPVEQAPSGMDTLEAIRRLTKALERDDCKRLSKAE